MPRKARGKSKAKVAAVKASEPVKTSDDLDASSALDPWMSSLLTGKRKASQSSVKNETEKAAPKKQKLSKKTNSKKREKEPADASKDGANKEASNGFLSQYMKDESWLKHLNDELATDNFRDIENALKTDYSKKEIFPPKELVFHAFNMCPFGKIKVVILGQDPYHDNGQACGMAFGVSKDTPPPPSLKNIYKELTTDIEGFKAPDHGCLDKWAEEGVLLLNATLTVEAHQPNSHKKYGWQQFTDNVIKKISSDNTGVVFILWGAFAHKKEKLIDTTKHEVIKTAHPSGCSYYLFRDCKCFSKANSALEKLGKKAVDWTLV